MREAARTLLDGLRVERLEHLMVSHNSRHFNFNSNNAMVGAVVTRMNRVGDQVEEVLRGTGVRSRLNDGINQTISDYMEASVENTRVTESTLFSLAQTIDELVDGRERLEEAAERMFTVGSSLSLAERVNKRLVNPVSTRSRQEPNYMKPEERLRNLYAEQVSQRSEQFAQIFANQLEPVLSAILLAMRDLESQLDHFEAVTTTFQRRMGRSVSSIDTEANERRQHGLLAVYLNHTYREGVIGMRQHIGHFGTLFQEIRLRSERLLNGLGEVKSRIRRSVEIATYPMATLTQVENSKRFVREAIHTTFQELLHVEQKISQDSSGLASDALQREVVHFRRFLDTCS